MLSAHEVQVAMAQMLDFCGDVMEIDLVGGEARAIRQVLTNAFAPDALLVAQDHIRIPDLFVSDMDSTMIEHRRADGAVSRVFVTIGYTVGDPGRPIEVFYSEGFRSGSDLEFTAQDVCVLISILLQHGVALEQIEGSLARRESTDGASASASLVGTIAAELTVPPAWHEASPAWRGEHAASSEA